MRLREEEDSDLMWLGKRIDYIREYIKDKEPDLEEQFKKFVDEYFIPIIQSDLSIEEEDYLFELVDSILEDFEEKYIKQK